MKIIDTENEDVLFEYEQKRREKENSVVGYTANDFAMVRTTNFLEPDHILKPLCSVPFVTNINSPAHNAIYQIFSEQGNVDMYDEEAYDEFIKKVNENSPLSSQYRSTIHFTLNGLVSSHSKGTFDDQNFIIIDRLSNHLGTDAIRSIRMEDTFVKGKFPLSGEAVIMINKNRYQELLKKYPWLDSYNIVLFNGDEKLAVEMQLLDMGIMPEKIETHSAKYSERTPLYGEFFASVTKEYGIEETKHYYSKEYKEDDQKNLTLWQIFDRDFYTKAFEFFKVDGSSMMESLLSYSNNREEILKKIILGVGVEKYCEFVQQYNKNMLATIQNGLFPSNDEILESGIIGLRKGDNKLL